MTCLNSQFLIHEKIDTGKNGKRKDRFISQVFKVGMLSANCDDTYLSYQPQDIKHELMYFPQETNNY